MRQVAESVTLPRSAQDILIQWAAYLTPLFAAIGFRLNRCLVKDGSERMTNPLPLAVYTTATRPNPVDWPGCLILVSDAAPPARLQGSDGTAWINLG